MVLGIIFVLSAISKQNFSDDHGINDERIKFRDETQLKTANSEIMIITPENKTYIDPMGGYYPAQWTGQGKLLLNHPIWDIIK